MIEYIVTAVNFDDIPTTYVMEGQAEALTLAIQLAATNELRSLTVIERVERQVMTWKQPGATLP